MKDRFFRSRASACWARALGALAILLLLAEASEMAARAGASAKSAPAVDAKPATAAFDQLRDTNFSIGETSFLLNGQPFQIRCGEMHFARIPREYWTHRLRLAHAMGLNTVCAYLFWNLHEPQPGKFDFTGMADAAEFCRLAQAEGLKVILRPGPYSCAEWDFGGLPWWLLKTPGSKVRTQDPTYLAACRNYLARVGRELAPLQVTRGGPIIMVQVENEYGSYGQDKEYLGRIRDDLKAAGFNVPLFTCDGPAQLKNDTRDDIFSVVNLGKDPEKNIQALRAIRSTGPLMVGEYYPGWFDDWGKPHHTGDTGRIVKELGWMLEHAVSFSIYMVHGGTSFGFDAGANSPPFSPQITSYDYDAPISEAGWTTPKFFALRELFSRHLNPGETIPDIPPRYPAITMAPFQLKECAALFANLPKPAIAKLPELMEKLGQAQGAILYRTELPPGAAGQLEITELHDYGLVFLDGKKLATLDRRLKQSAAEVPPRERPATLDILVDTFGHINYGHDMGEFKGIRKAELKTSAATNEITGWKMFTLPMDQHELAALRFRQRPADGPAFYRGVFHLRKTGDTFLDLSRWGKGMVWVNGHNLGRFWNLGPQQTLYCPAPWLKTGRNEILIFESNGAKEPVVAGLSEPILNQLKDENKHSRPPNIIFFLVDDLGWTELNCYSNHFNETPNLDRLASQGIRFTQAYAAAPVCSPTRAALMTGQYPARLHLTDYLHPMDKRFLSPDCITINRQLKKAGYISGLIGKWHLNGDYGRQRGAPQQHGFDEVICSEQSDIGDGSYWPPYKFMTNVPARLPHEYLTDRLNLEAVEFIQRHKDQPFFLYLAHYAPHTRLDAKPDKLQKYQSKAGAGKNKNNPKLAAMLESLDDGMGQILAELDKLHLTENTVVVFMSDNGGERTVTDNFPLRNGKSFLYEGGLRVPCIVTWPGHIKPNQICDEPIIAHDFYPTLMDLAGVKPDQSQVCDGLSLLPLFRGKKHLSRDALYWHYPMTHPHFLGGRSASAIRCGQWKLIEFLDTGKVELYDLSNDLAESHDLSAELPQRAEDLRQQLDNWKRAVKAE